MRAHPLARVNRLRDTLAQPMSDLDPELKARLDQLSADLDAGKIQTYEYNARRRALLKQGAAAPVVEPDAEPAAESVEPATLPKKPAAWGGEPKGTKTWSSEARTDDPTLRQTHAPLASGIGDGKAVFFLFGFRRSAKIDQEMMARELEHIQDDIEVLRNAGYTVVVDPQATKSEFVEAVTGAGEGAAGLAPAALYWSAHGHADGGLDCCDGARILPADLDPEKVSASLRVAILAACYVGAHSRTWKKALGGHPLVVGWGRPVTIDRAVAFLDADPDTETDLDDLIRRYLLADTPLPGEQSNAYSPLEPKPGRIADLPQRLQAVSAMLGARWREHEKSVEVDVPLAGGRSHFVHVSVVDSVQAYGEGEPLLCVEGDVGEITSLVDPAMLLAGHSDPGFARVALVKGEHDMPRIVAQGFLPLARVRDTDLASLVYQVAGLADDIEHRVFGGDLR
jgi:hypothetical protein